MEDLVGVILRAILFQSSFNLNSFGIFWQFDCFNEHCSNQIGFLDDIFELLNTVPVRNVTSWKEDASQKVMGSNPGGGNEFFTCEIKPPYDHLQVDFVNLISEMLFDPFIDSNHEYV